MFVDFFARKSQCDCYAYFQKKRFPYRKSDLIDYFNFKIYQLI